MDSRTRILKPSNFKGSIWGKAWSDKGYDGDSDQLHLLGDEQVSSSASPRSSASCDVGGLEKGERQLDPVDGEDYGRRKLSLRSWMQLVVVGLVVACLAFASGFLVRYGMETGIEPLTAMAETWTKPQGFKIVGMVFYGRRQTVNILDCYLKRNLAVNGGFLDEVHFMVHTSNDDDRQWLDGLLTTSEQYKKFEYDPEDSFIDMWKHATRVDTMYIKIDDDLVYIHDDAVPRIVQSLMAYPNALGMAANIINSPVTNWLHWHSDAIHAYLPDPNTPAGAVSDWRATSLPPYPKPNDADDNYNTTAYSFPNGHRWLPLPDTYENLAKTPMAKAKYDAFGPQWSDWAAAAQQHYSIFTNLEFNQMDRYWASNRDGIWNMWYEHYNINFLAIWGSTIANNEMSPVRHDEWNLSEFLPKKTKKPLLVDTHALVAHFAFEPQSEGLARTDLLDRYRLYANEMVCAADNQKTALRS